MTDHTPTPWPTPVYDNDTGPGDEAFWEWWGIESVGKFDKESDAIFAHRAVNSHAASQQFRAALIDAGYDQEPPEHDCEFVSNPPKGACEFHEAWANFIRAEGTTP